MYGKVQASALTETIPFISISATWGPTRIFHTLSPAPAPQCSPWGVEAAREQALFFLDALLAQNSHWRVG